MEDFSEVDAVGLGCSLDRFVEWKEVLEIIGDLVTLQTGDLRTYEKGYDRFKYIVNQYKEQPHLLDPYLEDIVTEIVGIVRKTDLPDEKMHQALKYFQLVTNVRGFKNIIQYLPHAVSMFSYFNLSDRKS